MNVIDVARAWRDQDPDEETRAELDHLIADAEADSAQAHLGSDKSNSWAGAMRLELAHEHLGSNASMVDLADPIQTFEIFQKTANDLDSWHEGGGRGPRPTGQLRTYNLLKLKWWTRLWAAPIYRILYDPDARSIRKRLMQRF